MTISSLDEAGYQGVQAMSEAHDAKEWQLCVDVGDAWIEARGQMPVLCAVWYAMSLMGVGRYKESLDWARVALSNVPPDELVAKCAAQSTYAQALCRVGRYSHSRKVLKDMVATRIDHPETLEKQGHVLLAISDQWEDGWKRHEGRLIERKMPDGMLPWDGKSKGRIGVLHEQGLGDAVLFARYLPRVAEQSGHDAVWFGPEQPLERWINGIQGATVGDRTYQTPVDYAVWSMSLPYLSGVKKPRDIASPAAPEALLEARRYRAHNARVRVGVCWEGSKKAWHGFERDFKYEEFASLFTIPNVEFVNLCPDRDLPEGAPFGKQHFEDVYESGELMTSLDLVVTVDTAIAHIAGSLGIPTIVLLPTVPDWRWKWPRESGSHFYPSITTIRRKNVTDLSCVDFARKLVEKYAEKVSRLAA